jgi:FkbM family methyltransferase
MPSNSMFSVLLSKIIWKLKQLYSKTRCYLGNGYYVYDLDNETKFISLQEDDFSHVIYVCKGHEKLEIDWCCRWIKARPGCQSVIDCGANIGFFSAVLAQRCDLAKIISIEGNARTAKMCNKNLHILKVSNSLVLETILSDDSADSYTIPDIVGREPWQRAMQVDSTSDIVSSTTLDQVISKFQLQPSLVKIDCEGFEYLILKGAINLLENIRPAFMIECNDTALEFAGTSRKKLFELLASYNYRLFHLASFTGYQPFGIELYDEFPSTEFNFAAIPNDDLNLDRWNMSAQLS